MFDQPENRAATEPRIVDALEVAACVFSAINTAGGVGEMQKGAASGVGVKVYSVVNVPLASNLKRVPQHVKFDPTPALPYRVLSQPTRLSGNAPSESPLQKSRGPH